MDFTDDVSGQVIGTMYLVGRLYYEGRPQGRKLYATTESDLLAQAHELKAKLRADCGEALIFIYPLDAWELRIFD